MPAIKRLMAQCRCGLIWQLGLMPMDQNEARAAIHAACPLCGDCGPNRFCWLAPIPTSTVLRFPIKERLS